MSNFVLSLIIIGVIFLLFFMYHSIKAAKDPNVKAASNLRMTINRFNLYTRLYDEHQDCLLKYGVESQEAQLKGVEILKQVPNMNEWRRYCDYRSRMMQEERQKMFKDY